MEMTSIEIITTEPRTAIAIRQKVRIEDIPSAMGAMFGELAPYLQGSVRCIGPPFALYHSWSDEGTDMEVGFPIIGDGVEEGEVHTIQLPPVKAATTMHIGPYDKLAETYDRVMSWMKENGHRPADYMWEEYLNSPEDTPPAKLMTKLYLPIV